MIKHIGTRRGFTLVELLVVIIILSVVTIATIPIIKPALDSRRLREASRMLAAHISEAQTRAVESGRPAGIWIERLQNSPTASMDIYMCETPLPLSGSDVNTKITVKVQSGQPHPANNFIQIDEATITFDASDFNWYSLLRPGDLIRFGYTGPWYRIPGNQPTDSRYPLVNSGVTTDPQGNTLLDNSVTKKIQPALASDYYTVSTSPLLIAPNFRCLPPAARTAGGWRTSYQILRQPIKLSTTPLQLPAGAILDLAYSGMGGSGFFPAGPTAHTNPIILTFSPSGALDKISELGQMPESVSGPIYFLVGKREKAVTMDASANAPYLSPVYSPLGLRESQSENHNFRDLENLWVSINPQTGLVSTAEVNEFQDSTVVGSNDLENLQIALGKSRQLATSAQTTGGL